MSALPSLIVDLFSTSLAVEQDNSLELIMDSASIIEPSPIQFSFDTPGWYFLGIAITITIIVLCVWRFIAYRRNAYRREAIKELDYYRNKEETDGLVNILTTLKLVAITTYGRDKVASLSGKDWFSFLESSSGKVSFKEVEEPVLVAFYSNNDLNRDVFNKLLSISKKWILTHA